MKDLQRKNRRVLFMLAVVFAGMLGLTAASVPLYSLFCRVTGWGGTTRVAETQADRIIDREITVRFDSSTAPNLPWMFKPAQREVTVRLGQDALISYTAKNRSAHATTGTALYNVTPVKAGRYFNKIECFCFGEQTLQPGQDAEFPVLFFVDPALADDPNMEEVRTITLSYTFFRTETPELEQALENFYNTPGEGT